MTPALVLRAYGNEYCHPDFAVLLVTPELVATLRARVAVLAAVKDVESFEGISFFDGTDGYYAHYDQGGAAPLVYPADADAEAIEGAVEAWIEQEVTVLAQGLPPWLPEGNAHIDSERMEIDTPFGNPPDQARMRWSGWWGDDLVTTASVTLAEIEAVLRGDDPWAPNKEIRP